MKGYKELVELLKKTQSSGMLDISNEAVCEYQDMIAHSNEDQLSELANGTLKESFYRVYGYAYGTVEAIRFHCKHGRKIQEMICENEDMKESIELLTTKLKKAEEKAKKAEEKAVETAEKFRELWHKADQEKTQLECDVVNQRQEIIELKAKLYDMMQAGQ